MESVHSDDGQTLSKKNICELVARLKPGGWKDLYDLVSKLPHSANNQGYYFDLDSFPEETIRLISAYLIESCSVFDDFVRCEKEHDGLVYKIKKTMECRQKKSRGTAKAHALDLEDPCENDDDLYDVNMGLSEYDGLDDVEIDDDEEVFHEKECDLDEDTLDADTQPDVPQTCAYDDLIAKYNRNRSESRKYMGSSYFTSGRWKGSEYREIDELLRNETKALTGGPLRRTTSKKTSYASEAKRGRAQRLPDILEREIYSEETYTI